MPVRSIEMQRKNGTKYRLETDLSDKQIREHYPKDQIIAEHAMRGKTKANEEDDM